MNRVDSCVCEEVDCNYVGKVLYFIVLQYVIVKKLKGIR